MRLRRANAWPLLRTVAGLSVSGVLLSVSCSGSELRAVVAGIEAAASFLDNRGQYHDEDITFGEWFLSEFD